MDHDRASELLATYALGATPDDERLAIELHVGDCPACRHQLEGYRLAAVELARGYRAPDTVDDEAAALDRSWESVRRRLEASDDT